MMFSTWLACERDNRSESEIVKEQRAAKAARNAAEAYRTATLEQRTRADGTRELPDMVEMIRVAEDAYRAVMAENCGEDCVGGVKPVVRFKSSGLGPIMAPVVMQSIPTENLIAAERLKKQARKLLKQALKAKSNGTIPPAVELLFSEVFIAINDGQTLDAATRDIINTLLNGIQMAAATAEMLTGTAASARALRREIMVE